MTRDDDPVTPEELQRARRLARLVDRMIDGAGAPAAPRTVMDADDRELCDTAAVLRAAGRTQPLEVERRDRVIQAALPGPAAAVAPALPAWRARAPWLLAAACAAVALLLALRSGERQTPAPPAPAARLPEALRSRPADALIGRIDPAASGDARARLDAIYADRLAGYRAARLARGSR